MRFTSMLARGLLASALLAFLLPTALSAQTASCAGLLQRFNTAISAGNFSAAREAAQPILDGGCALQQRIDVVEVLSAAAVRVAGARALSPVEEREFLESVQRDVGAGWQLLARLAVLADEAMQRTSLRSGPLDGDELRAAAEAASVAYALAAAALTDPARTRALPPPPPDLLDRLRARNQVQTQLMVAFGGTYRCADPRAQCDATVIAAGSGLRMSSVRPRLMPIRFPTNRHDLSDEAKDAIAQIGQILRVEGAQANGRIVLMSAAVPAAEAPRICIVGHTDETGTPTINDPLSVRRAAAVRDHLIRSGFPETRIIEAIGVGAREPLRLPSDMSLGRDAILALNRRVEIRIFNEASGRCEPFRLS